jgi:hypothetical protein
MYAFVLPPFDMFDLHLSETLPCRNGSVRQEDDIRMVEIAELSSA